MFSLTSSSNLLQLRIQGNQFTGPVPDISASIDVINYYQMQDNMFTGSFPADMELYTNLKYFRIDGNNVTSLVPKLSSFTTQLRLYGSGNFWLCPFPVGANSQQITAISAENCTCMPGSSCNAVSC